jgi:hypothetical protein
MTLTCVSGFWRVKNKHDDKFLSWFNNTLNINCPYIIFSNKEGIEILKKYRKDYPTHYIEYNLENFYTNNYKNKMITDPKHCPSVELNMIWNEKIFLIMLAKQLNPFNSDFFCWIDSGISLYRYSSPPNKPFPDNNKLALLPTDKFIYSASDNYIPSSVTINNYYHHIAGTSFILHKNIIDYFTNIYKIYLDKLVDTNNIWTDQLIFTHIHKDYPELFYKLCDGYGNIIANLY